MLKSCANDAEAKDARHRVSVVITLMALGVFGYVKGHFTGTTPWRSAMQTVLIGGVAAGVAFAIARAIS